MNLLWDPPKEGFTGAAQTFEQHLLLLESADYRKALLVSFNESERRLIEDRSRNSTEGKPRSLDEVLSKNLVIQKSAQPSTIAIFAFHSDPEVARILANRCARKYIDYTIDLRYKNRRDLDSVAIFMVLDNTDLKILNAAIVEQVPPAEVNPSSDSDSLPKS